jgi:hypothetical protein
MPPFRLQYISDIHLEFYDKLAFPLILKPNARYLALCGDIGYPHQPIFKSFIDYCSRNWEKVFYIPGNHEYYNKRPHYHWRFDAPDTMETIETRIQSIFTPYRNVYYLNKEIHELPEETINIIGATMWTRIPKDLEGSASGTLNDFAQIATASTEEPYYEQFMPAKMNELHLDHSKFILDSLNKTEEQGRKAIVLTHHMPSRSLVTPRFQNNSNNYLFYTEMTEHLKHQTLAGWLCGHSHSATKILYRPGVWLGLNCRGYPREVVEGFSPGAFLDVPFDACAQGAQGKAKDEEEVILQ